MSITKAQHDRLIAPLDRGRVEARDGMSYLNVSDVRRWLIRIFGFGGFSYTVSEAELVSHTEATSSKGKVNQVVSWKVKVSLDVPSLNAHYEGYAIGTSQQPSLGDAHDMAIKTAESDALKRCCVNLGDQFGLSLYFSKGREVCFSSVMRTMVMAGGVHDVEDLAIEGDVQAAPEVASSAIQGVVDESLEKAADDAALTVDMETGEVLEEEPAKPAARAAKKVTEARASRAKAKATAEEQEPEDESQEEPDPETERALRALADAGAVAVPEDFWECMTAIRQESDQQKRLRAATAYKLDLMNSGIRGNLTITSPAGTPITVDKAFDVALAGA
jgi:recombination DNA repair RAD52 pathway protein